MTIGDDFSIDYVNKRIWNKYAWGQGGSSTVYSVNALYSHLMDTFDEQGGMDDDIPMSAQTPNAYTMINGWFMDDESHKYLKEGAITTARGNNIINLLTFQLSGYVNVIFTDIGKQVVWDATNHGALLAYNNTTRKWWVRTADSIGAPEVITISGGTGQGLATANDLDNQTAVDTALEYLDTVRLMFVNGTILYSGAAGNSPVAHKVIHGQTSHATAYILNIVSPFVLANIEGAFQSAEVIEICEEIKFDAQTSQFTVGTTIDNGAGATAVIRKIVQDPQAAGTKGILFVTDVSGTWADNDPIEEGATQRATQNGVIATNTFTANTTSTVTFAATTTKDLDNGAGAQPYNVIIDLNGQSVATLYELIKTMCRRTSTI